MYSVDADGMSENSPYSSVWKMRKQVARSKLRDARVTLWLSAAMLSLTTRHLRHLPLHNFRAGGQLRLLRSAPSLAPLTRRLLSSRHRPPPNDEYSYDEQPDSDSHSRSRFERREMSGKVLVGGLLAVNGAVFLSWQAAQNLYVRTSPSVRLLAEY